MVQVNLCQKLLFLHQLTHNMTTDCSLNYKFNTWKFQAQAWREYVKYRNCFQHSEQFLQTTCSAKRRASDKDLSVNNLAVIIEFRSYLLSQDGFGLTSETLLFAIVTPTSLCKLRFLWLFVLGHFKLLMSITGRTVSLPRLGNIHLKQKWQFKNFPRL